MMRIIFLVLVLSVPVSVGATVIDNLPPGASATVVYDLSAVCSGNIDADMYVNGRYQKQSYNCDSLLAQRIDADVGLDGKLVLSVMSSGQSLDIINVTVLPRYNPTVAALCGIVAALMLWGAVLHNM